MKFSLIIPTKDRLSVLHKTIRALSQVINITDIDVLIINDSDKNISLQIEDFPTNLQVYKSPGKGVATARNFGASKAATDWLVFMDDDMLVQPETFLKLIPICNSNLNICLNTNWIYPETLLNLAERNPFVRYLKKHRFNSMEGWDKDPNWDHEKVFLVYRINSAFLLIHKNAFYKVNGYDEIFPFAGFEDHDFSERLKKSGVDMFVDPNNVIFHNEEDKIKLENWLERQRRGATTRKIALSKGYSHLSIKFSMSKKIVNKIVYASRHYLLNILNQWPQQKSLDVVYFFIVNRLLAAYSYAGYIQDETN